MDTRIVLTRPLEFGDFASEDTYPIDSGDSGKVYCHLCSRLAESSSLQPLCSSSGVFTRSILCENNAPVYLCLAHTSSKEFSWDALADIRLAQALS